MQSKLKLYIKRYTWLFPLILMFISVLYYINLFERLKDFDCLRFSMPIFKELQISVGVLLLITATLNWALVGYAKSINRESLRAKLKRKR